MAACWSPDSESTGLASRTTERWNPQSNRFERGALLPVGLANHEAEWKVLPERDSLLLFGGKNARNESNTSVLVFNTEDDTWRTASDRCMPGYTSKVVALPFAIDGKSFMWCQANDSGNGPWKLVSLENESGWK